MRQISKKRAELMKEAGPFREALKARVGCCEVCGKKRKPLDCHEVLRGSAYRESYLMKPCGILVACRPCHQEKLHDAKRYSVARQLAYLLASRPDDFDLSLFNHTRNPNAPRFVEMHEVEYFLEQHRNE